jgi:hypothetical protein
MNCFRRNNLNDVDSIYCARLNLRMKDIVLQDNCDVNITGGNISINKLRLSNFNTTKDTFIKSSATGELILDSDEYLPNWLRTSLNDISISIFNNDIEAVMYHEFDNFVFTSDYQDLCSNLLKLEDYFDVSKLCIASNNLSDTGLSSIKTRFQNELNLNKYIFSNLDNDMTFDYVTVKNLTIKTTKTGLLQDKINVFDLNQLPLSTNLSDINQNHGLCKIQEFPTNNTDIVPMSKTLKNVYDILYDFYTGKNENYLINVQKVIDYINSTKESYTRCNYLLSDVSSTEALKSLKLDKLKNEMHLTEEVLTVRSNANLVISGNSKLYVTPLINTFRQTFPFKNPFSEFVFVCYNDENLTEFKVMDDKISPSNDPNNLKYSTEIVPGMIKVISGGIEEISNSNTVTYNTFDNITSTHLRALEGEIDILKFQNILFSILDHDGLILFRFSSNLQELENTTREKMVDFYLHLELNRVVYEEYPEYNYLINKPKYLNNFINGPQYISSFNDFNEFITEEKKAECRSNLRVGTLGIQNIDNVNIIGTHLTSAFLGIKNTLQLLNVSQPENTSNMFVKSIDSDGRFRLEHIPEYSERLSNINGIVKMYDSLVYDDNATYTTELLNTIHTEFQLKFISLKQQIKNIKAHPKLANFHLI